jgi:hypothetical protein
MAGAGPSLLGLVTQREEQDDQGGHGTNRDRDAQRGAERATDRERYSRPADYEFTTPIATAAVK